MNAVILAIGDELISGQTVDTNSAWLSRELAQRGIGTLWHLTVPDNEQATADAIARAAASAEFVLVTGGLGPTEDDITRQALAQAMGVELALDTDSLRKIEDFFRRLNRPMVDANRIQAMIPRGTSAMENPVGTAPGIIARLGAARVFVMPGVPYEMKEMFSRHVAPALPREAGVILHRIVHTFGMGESDLGNRIADMMRRGANPLVGTTVAAGMVSVRILARAGDQLAAEEMAGQAIAEVRRRLGKIIVGEGDETMASAIGKLLLQRGAKLATAESCTGGMIGQMITQVSGSSAYYAGGVVAYSNALKESLLGVSGDLIARHGAVSAEVAAAMADGCRKTTGADYGVSVTGIAGPTGGTATKPVGLVFTAVSGPGGTQANQHNFPGTRDIVRLRSALAALNFLRLRLV